jgi:citrate/tricarballylate utilization protein
VTLPYGRFAHGAYRAAALLRYAVERRLPSPVGPAAD